MICLLSWTLAAALAGDFEFGVAGGLHVLPANHELYDADIVPGPLGPMGAGLFRFGYYPLADIGASLEADIGGGADGRIYGVRGMVEVGWPIMTTGVDFAPLIAGGIGTIGVFDTPAGDDSDMDYQWGLGFRMSAAKNVRVRVDVRHHPLAARGVDGVANMFSAWVGVSYRPGRLTASERVRDHIEELLSAYEEPPTTKEIDEAGTPRQVEGALIKIARDPRVPPTRRGRAVTVVATHPTMRVQYELQRLLGRELPRGWRADARKADRAAAAVAAAAVATTPATVPAAELSPKDRVAALVTRPPRTPTFEAPAAAVRVDPATIVVPPAKKHPRKVNAGVFRKALIGYSAAFPDAAVPIAAEVLATTDDPLLRVAAVHALQKVDSPDARTALATVPALRLRIVGPDHKPRPRVPVTVTLSNGATRDGMGFLDLVDPNLPLGPVKIAAEGSACERANGVVEVKPGAPPVDVVMDAWRAHTLRWSVTDDQGAPLSGTVRVDAADGTDSACAPDEVAYQDGAGTAQVGPGHFVLRVTADGYKYQDMTLDVTGDPAPLTFKLEPTVLRVVQNQIVADPIYFDAGKDTISKVSDPALDHVAQTILTADILRVTINGHTDDAGKDDVNLVLSQKRAEAVAARLISLGVPADRLTAVGYGETRPVVPGTTKAARAKNRRVEFVLEAK